MLTIPCHDKPAANGGHYGDGHSKLLELTKEKDFLFNRLQKLISVLPSGLIVLDETGHIMETNPFAETILGETLLGRPWIDVIESVIAPRGDDGHEISLKNGKRVRIDTRSLDSEKGQLILITDLTETRELQASLNRHERLVEMGEMAAQLAHQIRTPLSTALIYAKHLKSSSLTTEKHDAYADKLLHCLFNIEQQIKEILLYSKGTAIILEKTSLDKIIESLLKIIEPVLQQYKVNFVLQNAYKKEKLICNRDALVGALQNLINNAVESCGENPCVTLYVEPFAETFIQFRVTDNGGGISEDIQQKMFQPFFTTKSKGTGLGLANVHAVAKAHQGDALIESSQSHGTTAILRIPFKV